MTNVPQEIREIWTDLYKLFDKHFLMDNTEKDWIDFWNDANEICKKSGKDKYVFTAVWTIAEIFGDRMKREYEQKNGKPYEGQDLPGDFKGYEVPDWNKPVRETQVEQLHL